MELDGPLRTLALAMLLALENAEYQIFDQNLIGNCCHALVFLLATVSAGRTFDLKGFTTEYKRIVDAVPTSSGMGLFSASSETGARKAIFPVLYSHLLATAARGLRHDADKNLRRLIILVGERLNRPLAQTLFKTLLNVAIGEREGTPAWVCLRYLIARGKKIVPRPIAPLLDQLDLVFSVLRRHVDEFVNEEERILSADSNHEDQPQQDDPGLIGSALVVVSPRLTTNNNFEDELSQRFGLFKKFPARIVKFLVGVRPSGADYRTLYVALRNEVLCGEKNVLGLLEPFVARLGAGEREKLLSLAQKRGLLDGIMGGGEDPMPFSFVGVEEGEGAPDRKEKDDVEPSAKKRKKNGVGERLLMSPPSGEDPLDILWKEDEDFVLGQKAKPAKASSKAAKASAKGGGTVVGRGSFANKSTSDHGLAKGHSPALDFEIKKFVLRCRALNPGAKELAGKTLLNFASPGARPSPPNGGARPRASGGRARAPSAGAVVVPRKAKTGADKNNNNKPPDPPAEDDKLKEDAANNANNPAVASSPEGSPKSLLFKSGGNRRSSGSEPVLEFRGSRKVYFPRANPKMRKPEPAPPPASAEEGLSPMLSPIRELSPVLSPIRELSPVSSPIRGLSPMLSSNSSPSPQAAKSEVFRKPRKIPRVTISKKREPKSTRK